MGNRGNRAVGSNATFLGTGTLAQSELVCNPEKGEKVSRSSNITFGEPGRWFKCNF